MNVSHESRVDNEQVSSRVFTATDRYGDEFELGFHDNSVSCLNDQGNISFIIPDRALQLSNFLVSNAGNSFIQSEIKSRQINLRTQKISTVFDEITESLGAHSIRSNFINFGSGNAMRYAFLSNANNPYELIKREMRIINNSSQSTRRKERQLKPYIELKSFYDGDEKRIHSKKKIIGAAALSVLITVGGTSYYVYKKT